MPAGPAGIMVTVYHDGQFWLAHCERWDADGRCAARHVFGSEPALPEIAAFVNGVAFLRLESLPVESASAGGNASRSGARSAGDTDPRGPSTRSPPQLVC